MIQIRITLLGACVTVNTLWKIFHRVSDLAGACVTVNSRCGKFSTTVLLAGSCAAVNAFNDRLREIAFAGVRGGELP